MVQRTASLSRTSGAPGTETRRFGSSGGTEKDYLELKPLPKDNIVTVPNLLCVSR